MMSSADEIMASIDSESSPHVPSSSSADERIMASIDPAMLERFERMPREEKESSLWDILRRQDDSLSVFARALLVLGADPNAKDPGSSNDFTLLLYAAETDLVEFARILLLFHADPNCQDRGGFTPLMRAAQFGHTAFSELLLRNSKVEPDLTESHGRTALTIAAENGNVEICRRILDAGGSPDSFEQFGQTALMHAAGSGFEDVVRVLLRSGANCDFATRKGCQGRSGNTALILAVEQGHASVVQLLLRHHADPNILSDDRRSALSEAIVCQRSCAADIVKALLQHGASPDIAMPGSGESSLMLAMRHQRPAIIKLLVKHGVNTNLQDSRGVTALMLAVARSDNLLVRKILACSANVHLVDEHRETATLYAARQKNEDVADAILLAGGNPFDVNENGDTAFHIAVKCDSPAVLSACMRSHGARIAADARRLLINMFEDHHSASGFVQQLSSTEEATGSSHVATDEQTPPQIGEQHAAIWRELREELAGWQCRGTRAGDVVGRGEADEAAAFHAFVADKSPSFLTKLLVDGAWHYSDQQLVFLIERGADANVRDHDGWTALMKAAQQGKNASVSILLSQHAKPNVQEIRSGKTALILASEGGHTSTAINLLNGGASTDQQMKGGRTALMIASEFGFVDIVSALLANGADPDLRENRWFFSALMFSTCNNQRDVVEVLLNHRANLELVDRGGFTALMHSVEHGLLHITRLLIANHARPALHRGWNADDRAFTLSLLGSMSPTVRCAESPLITAVRMGRTACVDVLLSPVPDADGLWVHLSNPNLQSKENGNTALIYACEDGDDETVRKLVGYRQGYHPSDTLARNDRPSSETRAGDHHRHFQPPVWMIGLDGPRSTDASSVNCAGLTAFDLALEAQNASRVLSQLLDPPPANCSPSPAYAKIQRTPKVDTADFFRVIERREEHAMTVAALLRTKNSVDMTLLDGDGNSLLHAACRRGHLTIVRMLVDAEPKLLCLRDANGDTPLHIAVCAMSVRLVAELVEAKSCNITALNNEGLSPLAYAISGHPEAYMLKLLRGKIAKSERRLAWQPPIDKVAMTGIAATLCSLGADIESTIWKNPAIYEGAMSHCFNEMSEHGREVDFHDKVLCVAIDQQWSREVRPKLLVRLAGWAFFLILLTFVALQRTNGNDRSTFYAIEAVMRSLVGVDGEASFADIRAAEDFWSWSQQTLAARIFADGADERFFVDRHGALVHEPGYFHAGFEGVLVGRPRLRQFAAVAGSCSVPPQFEHLISNCITEFDDDSRMENDFGENPAFVWNEDLGGRVVSGKLTSYGGGGFAAILPSNSSAGKHLLSDLQNGNWININTRAVVLELTVYSANVNAFVTASLLVEFAAGGACLSSWDFAAPQLMFYRGSDFSQAFYEVLLCGMLIVFFHSELREMWVPWPDEMIERLADEEGKGADDGDGGEQSSSRRRNVGKGRLLKPVFLCVNRANAPLNAIDCSFPLGFFLGFGVAWVCRYFGVGGKSFFGLGMSSGVVVGAFLQSTGAMPKVIFVRSTRRLPPYFCNAWNWLSLLIIASFAVTAVLHATVLGLSSSITWPSDNIGDVFIDISVLADVVRTHSYALALCCFLCWTKFLEHIRVSRTLRLLVQLVGTTASQFASFSVVLAIFMAAFGCAAFVAFGLEQDAPRSLSHSVLQQLHGGASGNPIYIMAASSVCFNFVLLAMFVARLVSSSQQGAAGGREQDRWCEQQYHQLLRIRYDRRHMSSGRVRGRHRRSPCGRCIGVFGAFGATVRSAARRAWKAVGKVVRPAVRCCVRCWQSELRPTLLVRLLCRQLRKVGNFVLCRQLRKVGNFVLCRPLRKVGDFVLARRPRCCVRREPVVAPVAEEKPRSSESEQKLKAIRRSYMA